jgi:hypothetical protein
MPFQKNHKLGAKRIYKRPLDKQIIGFKGYEGQKEKLKNILNWQDKLREYVDKLIEEEGE